MKKILFYAISLLMICSCESVHRLVVPLPSAYTIESLDNITVPARFKVYDVDWTNGTLTLDVFSEDIYDMVDVLQMTVGDTILYMDKRIVVNSLLRASNQIDINGGLGEENGAWIKAYEGGTWRAIQFDDHSVYTLIGIATLPLSSNFTIIDCGEQYTDPYDTIKVNQRQYLENLADGKVEFNELNTQVQIDNGKVTSIVRRWIP